MTTPGPVVPVASRLEVSGATFVQELQRMAKVLGRRRNIGEALFRFAEGILRVRIGGAEISLPATGEWQGEARVAGAWLRALAQVPPAVSEPLVVQASGGRLRIGTSSAPCRWQVPGAATLEIPLQPDLRTLLRLALAHSDAELEKSGLTPAVAGAHEELERRIDLATRHLAPLGVTPTDLRLLVSGKLAGDG